MPSPRWWHAPTRTAPGRRRPARRLVPRFELLEDRHLLATAVNLLHLGGVLPDSRDAAAGLMASLAGSFYYVVNRHGRSELWRTDGSELGTTRIDVSSRIHSLTVVGEELAYVRGNAGGGESLRFLPGLGYPPLTLPTDLTHVANLTDVAGTLFFTAVGGAGGVDLWMVEPGRSGVTPVHDFQGGLDDATLGEFTAAGGHLYFTASVPFGGSSLWQSDGTDAGTLQLAPLGTGGGPGAFHLTEVGGELFFTDSSLTDARLWKTTGGGEGLELVKTLSSAQLLELADVGGTLFFAAAGAGGESDVSLWKSDGTEAGTALVKGIDRRDFTYTPPGQLVGVGGVLYFTANDEVHGKELWRSDGTPAGTYLVRDIYPNFSGSFADSPGNLVDLNGALSFAAISPQYGMALWKSDGTAAGTVAVTPLQGEGAWLTPIRFAVAGPPPGGPPGDRLYFATDHGSGGITVWKSDGTAAGTQIVRETGIPSPGVAEPTALNGNLFFAPDNGFGGTSLWATDGTAAGTRLLVGSGPSGGPTAATNWSRVGNLFVFQDSLYFTADDGEHGEELWATDGTPAGTSLFADLAAGRLHAAPRDFTVAGGAFYFTTHEGTRLWRSNGTAAGTTEFAGHAFTTPGSYATNLTGVDGALYFLLTDDVFSGETTLWKSDGTPGGTVPVQRLHYPTPADFDPTKPRPANVLPDHFFAHNGALYFSAEDGVHGRELWRSDGTPEGTRMVKDINQVFGTHPYLKSNPAAFLEANGALYFTADDGVHGRELWTTDGTAAGTHLVANIRSDTLPGYESANPTSLVNANGTLYFGASDGGFEGSTDPAGDGIELWKSDGTEPGTAQVKDIRPGPWDAAPRELTAVGGAVYFSVNDGSTGRSLWVSDGTPQGTVRFADDANQTWARPHHLVNAGGTLFFVSLGSLWALPADAPAPEVVYKQRALVLNQDRLGHLSGPATGDRWVFSANAGEQVRFDLGQTFGQVRFRLKGPGGWVGFTDQAADSGVLALPASGRYELEAYVVTGSTATYSFRLEQAFTNITVGESYQGTIAGTGYSQVFQVNVPFDGALLTSFDNANNSDNIEIYLRRGAPPTRNLYDQRRERVGADHALLIPDARADTWYVLVYAAHAPAVGGFSLRLDNPPVVVKTITPPALPNFEPTWVTVSGAGFDESTTLEFVGGGGVRTPTDLVFVSPTSIRALLDLGTWTPDNYRVLAHKAGFTDELATPFIVTREPYRLETRLIVPERVGFNVPIRQTIWIEYTNTGRIPMPAPLLTLTGSLGARLTLAAGVEPRRGLGNLPGTADTLQVLGLGSSNHPWQLMPGETGRVPVYYLGLSQPGNNQVVEFSLRAVTADDERAVDWGSLSASLRQPALSEEEWGTLVGAFDEWFGTTWGDYVGRLGAAAEVWHGLNGAIPSAADQLYGFSLLQLSSSASVPFPPNAPPPGPASQPPAGAASNPLARIAAGQLRAPFGYRREGPLVDWHDGIDVRYQQPTDVVPLYDSQWQARFYDRSDQVAGPGNFVTLRDAAGREWWYLHVQQSTDALYAVPSPPNAADPSTPYPFKSPPVDGTTVVATTGESGAPGQPHLHLKTPAQESPLGILFGMGLFGGAAPDAPVQTGPQLYWDPTQIPVTMKVRATGWDLHTVNIVPYAINGVAVQPGSYQPVTIDAGDRGGVAADLFHDGSGSPHWDGNVVVTGLPGVPAGTPLGIYQFLVQANTYSAQNESAIFTYYPADKTKYPKPPPTNGPSVTVQGVATFDPNDLLGPAGYGGERFLPADATLAYTIRFENEAAATAPAREITITNPLDTDLDLATLELTEITFANHTIPIPAGNDFYEAGVLLTVNGARVLVEVTAGVDREARQLSLTLRAVDPDTGWFSEDPLVGLLYPEDDTGRGQGSISYLVKPRVGLASGTVLDNRARIVFDFNDPIDTPQVFNTLDAAAPTSQVAALPAVIPGPAFTVTWGGQDEPNGSGVAHYDVLVSVDGGPFAPWLTATPLTSATYTGTPGHAYAFVSVAIDRVGNRQAPPAAAHADTFVALPLPPPPSPAPAPVPRAVAAGLAPRKRGKQKKLVAVVTFSDGRPPREVVSPFQKPQWQGIVTALHDQNGDGVPDSLRFTARRGTRKAVRIVLL